MEEKIFFNQGDVTVSNTRFTVNGQTYAMSNVTSVKSHITPPERGGILLILFGLACFFGNAWIFAGGVLSIILGVSSLIASGTMYSVILNTSSGENQVLFSTDKNYINNVIFSLNEAIVSRG